MSFQDIEAGYSANSSSSSGPISSEDAAFMSLQSSLSLQVFKINANIQGIRKLVEQLGTPRDSNVLRKRLHDLTESSQSMVKRGSEDLKKLAVLQGGLPHQHASLQKTSHDFQLSLSSFQHAQRASAERQRTVVEGVRMAVEDDHDHQPGDPVQHQSLLLQSRLSPHELAYQESLIQERENDIREIESGIHELAEIYRDLGTIVGEQGEMLDNIEANISAVAVDTSRASEELTTAAHYQRKAGKRAACLMIVLTIVTAIVLLAVLS
ncbi:t-SNARE [Guyanagaster necrorhizus]|uniref:t-SNARE n=1 Tax=Guyanagaster necrorhizus TaxID=856835 RepID=A0A9P8ALI8_9AGAR|nr:t-SNARE [Guyanagaster necrorhizus MCA 3950]KAG7439759.1 t-SNARE [Guyanagaster necrorhizus MCA 3950]